MRIALTNGLVVDPISAETGTQPVAGSVMIDNEMSIDK